jgi:hypothetical protein
MKLEPMFPNPSLIRLAAIIKDGAAEEEET